MSDLLTADELTKRMRLKAGTIRSWARRGRIPVVRVSANVMRFDPAAVLAALTARKAVADAR
jgi:excisionase family DNA binding protein